MKNNWWRSVRETSARVHVTFDSIVKWDVAPNINLAPGILERGGLIAVSDTAQLVAPAIEKLIDGDPATAFRPDDYADVPRQVTISITLGAAFRINRIRLFPRLDEDHRLFFPQLFQVSTNEGSTDQYEQVASVPVFQLNFHASDPNREPVVDRLFTSRDATTVYLQMEGGRSWELAEVEIYSDGTVPQGTFVSKPLSAEGTLHPIWGRVRFVGGDISALPIILQTRTGPDRDPLQHFRRTGVGDDLELTSAGIYNAIPEEEQGPVRPNPEWSNWETVSNGLVSSPQLMRYIQFRLFLPEPGTILRRLIFEYTKPPVVQELRAEIDPRISEAGKEEIFALSILAHMLTPRIRSQAGSTGFRRLQVLTKAQVGQVEKVLVDDREVSHSVRYQPGEGFTVTFDRRITQDGSFVQILFRATIFRDGTRFGVRALDLRVIDRRLEQVYQEAFQGDVDLASPGGELVVRLREDQRNDLLLAALSVEPATCTPNGDNINDICSISYDLYKLIQPAGVRVDIFSLNGQRLRQVYAGEEVSGHYVHIWDGADEGGRRVAPGLYIYRVRVDANGRTEDLQGLVGVTY